MCALTRANLSNGLEREEGAMKVRRFSLVFSQTVKRPQKSFADIGELFSLNLEYSLPDAFNSSSTMD